MIQRSREWLLNTMALTEITGMKPENIHFCSRISGPEGKGELAKRLGITHMIDDHDEALKAVYNALTENGRQPGKFPWRGQLFHFAQSGKGEPPKCDKWRQEDRPNGPGHVVYAVSNWMSVMHLLNVRPPHPPVNQNNGPSLPLPSGYTVTPTEDESPHDLWIELVNCKFPPCRCSQSHIFRRNTEASWTPSRFLSPRQ